MRFAIDELHACGDERLGLGYAAHIRRIANRHAREHDEVGLRGIAECVEISVDDRIIAIARDIAEIRARRTVMPALRSAVARPPSPMVS